MWVLKKVYIKIIIHDSARPLVTSSLLEKINKNLALKKELFVIVNDKKLIEKEKVIKM